LLGDVRIDIKPVKTASIRCDAHNLPLRSKTMDKIICYNVLEHLVSPYNAMCEMKRVLDEKGYIFIKIPNLTEIRRVLSISRNPLRQVRRDTQHIQGWDVMEFKRLIKRVNLRIKKIGWLTEGKNEKYAFLNPILRKILPDNFYYKNMYAVVGL
jgi:ubiquinone/menaquinone biosynthesis C-methylase UbiE